ncbi:MAG TPA: metallophosphoesterase [Syntrophorhabdaceae bacterium]|nr:metallophosphoesterase [Syntrophorhabdaceae bacterium]
MFRRLVRLFSCIVVFCVYTCSWAANIPFAVISDTHVGKHDSVYPSVLHLLKIEQIDTIIHTGDAINNPGNRYEWKKFLAAQGPQQTVHLAAGNHDITNKQSFETYLKFFPKPYYSFSEGDVLFILLNTEIPGEESTVEGKQLSWLEAELRRSFRYKFVFLHEPLFPVIHLGLAAHEASRDMLHRIFVENGVSLVVAGHDHIYHRTMRDGITYIIMPPCRTNGLQLISNAEPGYVTAFRKNGGFIFALKDIRGKTKDEFIVVR